jgi:hypothetical protein
MPTPPADGKRNASGGTAAAEARFVSTVVAIGGICLAILALYLVTSHGLREHTGNAFGKDFLNIWTASRLLLDGRTTDIFDFAKFGAAQRDFIGTDLSNAWSYPPTILLLIFPLALLPYKAAYVTWLLATAVPMLLAARALLGSRRDALLLLLAPSTTANIIFGQNGFLTTALLVGAIAIVDRRPLAAGALFGLLTIKPQLGLLVPLLLALSGRWRVLAAAGIALACVAGLIAVRRALSDPRLAAAALFTATPLVSPYLMIYDLGLLSVAVLLLQQMRLRHGPMRYEEPVLMAAWLLPMLTVAFGLARLPLAPLLVALLFGVAVVRLRRPGG